MSNGTSVSKCCNAEVINRNSEGVYKEEYYQCTKCRKYCEVVEKESEVCKYSNDGECDCHHANHYKKKCVWNERCPYCQKEIKATESPVKEVCPYDIDKKCEMPASGECNPRIVCSAIAMGKNYMKEIPPDKPNGKEEGICKTCNDSKFVDVYDRSGRKKEVMPCPVCQKPAQPEEGEQGVACSSPPLEKWDIAQEVLYTLRAKCLDCMGVHKDAPTNEYIEKACEEIRQFYITQAVEREREKIIKDERNRIWENISITGEPDRGESSVDRCLLYKYIVEGKNRQSQ